MLWPVVYPSVLQLLVVHIFNISRTISLIELKLDARHSGTMEMQNCLFKIRLSGLNGDGIACYTWLAIVQRSE